MPKVYSDLELNGNFTYDNNPSDGYVLTTNSSGLVSWTSSTSVIATASSTDFGIMKVGNTLNINEFGVTNIGTASETVLGGFLVGSGVTMSSDGRLSVKTDLGNVLYVSENGNDSTGEKGNLHRPYKTLYAAKTGATAGDVIHVFPQTIEFDNRDSNSNYWNSRTDEVNLWKDGVKYYFELGTKIILRNQSQTGVDLALFNPGSTSGETCMVDGYLEFEQYGYGPNTFNGINNYFKYNHVNAGGCNFYTKTKKLSSYHTGIYELEPKTTNPVNIYEFSDEHFFQFTGGNVGYGSAYTFNGGVLNSSLNYNSRVTKRDIPSNTASTFYFRNNLENSKFRIYGDYIYTPTILARNRTLTCRDIVIDIKEIDYSTGFPPFNLLGVITTESGGSFSLELNGNLNDISNNSLTTGIFHIRTGSGNVINFNGNINTKTDSGTGRFIVSNTVPNTVVNINGNINLMGTGTTSNIILQAYSSGSVVNFKGEVEGNYSFLAHPRLGGTVNINNSYITSTADNFVMLDHTDTTESTFRLNNSYVKGSNDLGTFADGQYLNTMINNSTIINTGSGDTLTNLTNNGTLQVLNSSLYTGGTSSISYGTSSVISSNTVVNATYSIPNLYGDITTLTNIII